MQVSPVDRSPNWRPPGADLYSTGASGAVPVRPVNPANPVESTDRLGEGAIVREPDKPSTPDKSHADWTATEAKKKEEAEKAAEPPKETISKQLLEFIQSMWRASSMAVDMVEEANKTAQKQNTAQQVREQPLTYSDPKVKRTGGL